jgi:hypothetical protein
MNVNPRPFTPEERKLLDESAARAQQREDEFYKRHHLLDEGKPGFESEAHIAWARAAENEYRLTKFGGGRVLLFTPLAKLAFLLGYRIGQKEVKS